jgi:L-ascorbate metabolism protein UlaG (beta-lactamase superfamily)
MFRKILKVTGIAIIIFILITIVFMQQDSFGKLPSGTRSERISKSPQFEDGIFTNIQETKMLADDASYFSIIMRFLKSNPGKEPDRPLPAIKTNLMTLPIDSPTFVWFGHSSYLLSIGGKKILSDPVFSKRASPVSYSGPKNFAGTDIYSIEDFPDLDIVVITHDHYDHLDHESILKLKNKTKFFCVPLGVGSHLEHWGVPTSQIREFDWWEGETVMEGVHFTATPARHFSGRGFTRNKTLWASFVVETGGLKIFIGGDSGYDESFKDIGNKFGPFDMAMLECGQYDPAWPFIHMMPEETVQAGLDLNAKAFLPVHWGKFSLSNHPWRDPIIRAVNHAKSKGANITAPRIGQVVNLKGELPFDEWWNEQ